MKHSNKDLLVIITQFFTPLFFSFLTTTSCHDADGKTAASANNVAYPSLKETTAAKKHSNGCSLQSTQHAHALAEHFHVAQDAADHSPPVSSLNN